MATVIKEQFRSGIREEGHDPEDRTRPLTAQEVEWKERINDRLLTVLDLSLIDTVEPEKARAEIREIADRLLTEGSAPLSRRQRKLIIGRIEDEVMGLDLAQHGEAGYNW